MAGLKLKKATLLTAEDDVGVLLTDVQAGEVVFFELSATGERLGSATARADIPFGHKIARADFSAGENLTKYGQPFGQTKKDIYAGDHVHTHNVSSLGAAKREAKRTDKKRAWPAAWLKEAVQMMAAGGGCSDLAAEHLADHITEAHLRGVETHGLGRLEPYLSRIASGGVNGRATPVLKGDRGLLMVDGQNGVGHHVSVLAADAVGEAAAEYGVGMALVRNSNHFGFAGYYATRIAAHGQVGLAGSNGQVCLAPPGGLRPIFSNDPLAVAAPIGKDEYMEFDMATSVVSRAKIAEAATQGALLPLGWAVDKAGRDTRDASAALQGSLLPFGGQKGFALVFALEVLIGVLSGGAYADLVSSKEAAPDVPEKVSHFFLAVDLRRSLGAEPFVQRMQDLIRRVVDLPVGPGVAPLRYPGQRRWALRRERLRQGIPLEDKDYQNLIGLARMLDVKLEKRPSK